jgi:hypothetical protein
VMPAVSGERAPESIASGRLTKGTLTTEGGHHGPRARLTSWEGVCRNG